MKKIVLTALSMALLGSFSNVKAGEMCEEISFLKEVAWDIEYEYRKKCYYAISYAYFNANQNYISVTGVTTGHTSWSPNNSYNCASQAYGSAQHFNQQTFQTHYQTELMPFNYSSTEEKEVGRVATAWEHHEIWRDRYGNPCTPYGGN